MRLSWQLRGLAPASNLLPDFRAWTDTRLPALTPNGTRTGHRLALGAVAVCGAWRHPRGLSLGRSEAGPAASGPWSV